MSQQKKQIAIIGLGLLGGSIALAIQQAAGMNDVHIIGYDQSQEVMDFALSSGIVHEVLSLEKLYSQEIVAALDLLFLAIPVNGIIDQLRNILTLVDSMAVRPNLTITDVGSTKLDICRYAWSFHSGDCFIGSHPMAGKENSGLEYASADLYRQATIFLCSQEMPANDAKQSNRHKDKVASFWEMLGGIPSEISPDCHDVVVAHTSHLPHLLSMSLMSYLGKHPLLKESLFTEQKKWFGGGLVDFTRIAASSPLMWVDIFEQNIKELQVALDGYMEELQQWRNHLGQFKRSEVQELLRNSASLRNRMVPPQTKHYSIESAAQSQLDHQSIKTGGPHEKKN